MRSNFKVIVLLPFLWLALGSIDLLAQKTSYPLIGAQIFIEPGQSAEDIDQFFRILKENNMEVCRIRLFGSHMLREEGVWDFSLYDRAFDAAERYGVKLFATLFPPTDELTDVGGFKFPYSRTHMDRVADYIRAMVTHFSEKPAMYTWVLQNEPGSSGAKVAQTDLSKQVYAQWSVENQFKLRDSSNDYMRGDFTQENFLVYYTNWYLRWIADQVRIYDTVHYLHINPHQVLETLPEYDFNSYRDYLTSLGVSMHLSWHFGYFNRDQYSVGVSAMADLIRGAAMTNPFWVTELQGGNVTASGDVVLCPTADETSQWLWTSVAAGAQGVIFWSLNQRKAVMEAAEWGMIDFQRQPSDRLIAASEVARTIMDNKEFFKNALPVKSNITVLYNKESLWIQKKNAAEIKDTKHEGRKKSAVMKSVAAAYEAISSWGVVPDIEDMDRFDWANGAGRVAVLSNVISLPHVYVDQIKKFVSSGGRLIATSLTGFYDEDMRSLFMDGFPLNDCFGADMSEFKATSDYLWCGHLKPTTATPLIKKGDVVTAVRNVYGSGDVVWLPSMFELALWQQDNRFTRDFYGKWVEEIVRKAPLRFAASEQGILMRVMNNGSDYLVVVVNQTDQEREVVLKGTLSDFRLIYGKATLAKEKLRIAPGQCAVYTAKLK